MRDRNKAASLINVLFATTIIAAMVGCGSKSVNAEALEENIQSASNEEATEVEFFDEVEPEVFIDESATDASEVLVDAENIDSPLPRYEYPGPEYFYTVLYDFLRDEYGQQYSNYDVCIPTPYIIEIDDSDQDDIKVYGDFWIYNYNLEGDTLMFTSGGSYAGLIHMKNGEEGYEITGMDLVGDGSNFEPTARAIFGDKYDELLALSLDKDAREATRAQIIANYVAANDLNITQYQDYGWPPVQLPAENIDNFYSQLD